MSRDSEWYNKYEVRKLLRSHFHRLGEFLDAGRIMTRRVRHPLSGRLCTLYRGDTVRRLLIELGLCGHCAICGAPVIGARRKYCSDRCATEGRHRKEREARQLQHQQQFDNISRLRSTRQARRTCLACNRDFISEGPWNRICPSCKLKQQHIDSLEGSCPIDRTVRVHLTSDHEGYDE